MDPYELYEVPRNTPKAEADRIIATKRREYGIPAFYVGSPYEAGMVKEAKNSGRGAQSANVISNPTHGDSVITALVNAGDDKREFIPLASENKTNTRVRVLKPSWYEVFDAYPRNGNEDRECSHFYASVGNMQNPILSAIRLSMALRGSWMMRQRFEKGFEKGAIKQGYMARIGNFDIQPKNIQFPRTLKLWLEKNEEEGGGGWRDRMRFLSLYVVTTCQ